MTWRALMVTSAAVDVTALLLVVLAVLHLVPWVSLAGTSLAAFLLSRSLRLRLGRFEVEQPNVRQAARVLTRSPGPEYIEKRRAAAADLFAALERASGARP